MSRIGRKPIEVPPGVKVSIQDRTVTIEGPKGRLSFTHRSEVAVVWNEDEKSLVVSVDEADADDRKKRALWGTTRSILGNMVQGVTKGYQRDLEVVGVGWGAEVQGDTLRLNIGYANPVLVPIPQGIDVRVDRAIIRTNGADKQQVGQFAAEVRARRKPEPYNGKGIKYTTETIRRKQSKQFGQ